MDRIRTLKNKLIQSQNNSRDAILSLTESPIEKIFLLYILNFVENAIADDTYSKFEINGYSFLKNSDYENFNSNQKISGLQIVSCGTGVTIDYPKGIPLSDGSYLKEQKNDLRRSASIVSADDNVHFSYIQRVLLFPQYQIQIDQNNYRLDFAFLLYENIDHDLRLVKKVAIECDGYDYHSSPKHFKRDRERARSLQHDDWTVIRYSGSDINQRLFQNYKTEVERIFDLMGFSILNR